MIIQHKNKSSIRKSSRVKGCGVLNNIINSLPFELHLPGYNYCGPGTKLEKRLRRGDKGINPLDEACKQHDIAYSQYPDLELATAADRRWRESPNLSEKLMSVAVNKIMKFKVKRGMGIALSKVIKDTKKEMKKHLTRAPQSNEKLLKEAVRAAKKLVKGKIIRKPRIIPVPKKGGFLPLVPLLGALAAAGSLAGGVSTAAKNIYDMTRAKSDGKVVGGKGLYMRPYKSGMGLYLTPYVKKNI